MYYNPESGEKLSRKDLCVLTNISIPEGTEELSGWYKLTYADMPEQSSAFIIEQGPVELVDGHYVQTWVQTARDPEEVAAEELAQAKAERAAAVSRITVTVDGMTFDGDEVSQERMARTITAAVATGEDMSATTTWVLADNTVAQVSMQQLAQALRAAGEQQTALWTVPYQEETVVEPTTEPETVPETPTATEEPADTEATA